jgi:peptidase E
MKFLLTSTGLMSEEIQNVFLNNVPESVEDVRVIFVPTAANDEESKAMLPKCMNDLTKLGVIKENILEYDLDGTLSVEDALKFDAIYFCGGSTKYLLERINEIGFSNIISEMLKAGKLFIGVSAGSKICGSNYEGNLGYLNRNIELHCKEGSPFGKVSGSDTIYLTDSQALVIYDNDWTIIGD